MAIWVLTFAVGALLMIAAFLLQAMTVLLARLANLEQDVRVFVAASPGPAARATTGGQAWH